MFGSTVTMEMKDQDVSHRGMVTSGRERPCFALSDTITQQRDKAMDYGNLEELQRGNMRGETGNSEGVTQQSR